MHPQLLEARKVGGVDQFQVRDLVAVIQGAVVMPGLGNRIQGRANGSVADGVDVHGQSRGVCGGHDSIQILLREIRRARVGASDGRCASR